jgi:photosystem II stability/assembly factor-like uncharacterized protein
VFVAVLLGLTAARFEARAQNARFHALATSTLGEDFTCIGISHRDPDFVLVGTSTGSLLRSTDGGATWQRIVVTPSRTLFFGRERQPDPRFEYALGLPGKSPHLQRWIRQKGLNTSGVNWQQLLVQKGDKMVSITWIEVDWNNENRVFVGTTYGLYYSRDKARTFVRIYQGRSSTAERMVNAVATDPADPNHILMGTASGIFDSKDGGATFHKTMNYYLRSSYIREIWFDPQQPGLVHVAMGGSSMASPDGGKNWITTHWDEWGPRADVQSISLGPQNIRVMGTRDGVFASWQGGEMGSWQRRGIRFVGTVILKVLATVKPHVWYALTDQAVWMTQDFGLNWTPIMHLGGREAARWIKAFHGREDQIWLVTNRQVYRSGMPRGLLSMRAPEGIAASRRLLDVPPLHKFHKKVLRHARVYFPDIQDYRDRSPWAALLPHLTVGAHYTLNADVMTIKNWMHRLWPYHYFNASRDRGLTFEVFAYWELERLIMDRRKLPHWGRIDRNLAGVRLDLTERVQRLYREYVRVARILVTRPPANLLTRSFLKIRLQEIAAYFDAISGGYWSKKTGGL